MRPRAMQNFAVSGKMVLAMTTGMAAGYGGWVGLHRARSLYLLDDGHTKLLSMLLLFLLGQPAVHERPCRAAG
jgi:hypothetical protein